MSEMLHFRQLKGLFSRPKVAKFHNDLFLLGVGRTPILQNIDNQCSIKKVMPVSRASLSKDLQHKAVYVYTYHNIRTAKKFQLLFSRLSKDIKLLMLNLVYLFLLLSPQCTECYPIELPTSGRLRILVLAAWILIKNADKERGSRQRESKNDPKFAALIIDMEGGGSTKLF